MSNLLFQPKSLQVITHHGQKFRGTRPRWGLHSGCRAKERKKTLSGIIEDPKLCFIALQRHTCMVLPPKSTSERRATPWNILAWWSPRCHEYTPSDSPLSVDWTNTSHQCQAPRYPGFPLSQVQMHQSIPAMDHTSVYQIPETRRAAILSSPSCSPFLFVFWGYSFGFRYRLSWSYTLFKRIQVLARTRRFSKTKTDAPACFGETLALSNFHYWKLWIEKDFNSRWWWVWRSTEWISRVESGSMNDLFFKIHFLSFQLHLTRYYFTNRNGMLFSQPTISILACWLGVNPSSELSELPIIVRPDHHNIPRD